MKLWSRGLDDSSVCEFVILSQPAEKIEKYQATGKIDARMICDIFGNGFFINRRALCVCRANKSYFTVS